MSRVQKPPLTQLFVVELAALLALVLIAAWGASIVLAKSLAAGGLIFIVSTAWLAKWSFHTLGGAQGRQAVQNFYRGEMGKFILTMVGFATVFKSLQTINAGAVFAGYGILWVLHCCCLPLLLARWRP